VAPHGDELAPQKVAALPPLRSTLQQPAPGAAPVLELDELWSFVRSKEEPAWVWVALDCETRQVVACTLGDRRQESGRSLWEQAPEPWRGATGYTAFWDA
jgi:insertion element IS1 protein InsB